MHWAGFTPEHHSHSSRITSGPTASLPSGGIASVPKTSATATVWNGTDAGRLVGVAFIPTASAPFQVWKGNAAEKPVSDAFIPSLGRKRRAWDENNPAVGRWDCLIPRFDIDGARSCIRLPAPTVGHRVARSRTSALPNPVAGHWLCAVAHWDCLILWSAIGFCTVVHQPCLPLQSGIGLRGRASGLPDPVGGHQPYLSLRSGIGLHSRAPGLPDSAGIGFAWSGVGIV